MRRDIQRLLAYWADNPPPHVAMLQVRDVVITALGGEPPKRKTDKVEYTSADEWAALAESLG